MTQEKKKLYRILFFSAFILAAVLLYFSFGRGLKGIFKPAFNLDSIQEVDGLTQVNENVFIGVDKSCNVNMTLAVSGKEAILIDAGNQSSEVAKMKDFIGKRNLTLKSIIITHDHFDHVKQLDLFKTEGVPVYQHDNTENGQMLQLGELSLRILDTPGHSEDKHISVELVDFNILVAGDIVATSEPPAITSADWIETQKATLEMIKKNKYALIIPGHGHLINPELAVNRQLQYFRNAEKLIGERIKNNEENLDLTSIKLDQCMNVSTDIDVDGMSAMHKYNLYKILEALKKAQ